MAEKKEGITSLFGTGSSDFPDTNAQIGIAVAYTFLGQHIAELRAASSDLTERETVQVIGEVYRDCYTKAPYTARTELDALVGFRPMAAQSPDVYKIAPSNKELGLYEGLSSWATEYPDPIAATIAFGKHFIDLYRTLPHLETRYVHDRLDFLPVAVNNQGRDIVVKDQGGAAPLH